MKYISKKYLFFALCLVLALTGSKFAITAQEATPLKVMVLFINNKDVYDRKEVNLNECIKDPLTPLPNEEQTYFIGWYEDQALTKKYDFNKPVKKEMRLYAKFSDTYVVRFKDQNNQLIEKVKVKKSELVKETSKKLKLKHQQYFNYWTIEGDGSQAAFNFARAKLNKDINLVPYVSAKHTVFFISSGTKVSPVQVLNNESVGEIKSPYKQGYLFVGWLDENKKEFDLKTPITKTRVLSAKFIKINKNKSIEKKSK